jgi:tRNA1Val (adenine37-N6)-methyltransferase
MTVHLKPEERLDDLQVKGYEIIQHPGKFCFGMDAVLLANFARVKKNEKVLDLGTGTGIIPILLSAKTEGEYFRALEIQEESADMARRSVLHNHLEERIEIVTGDIKEAAGIFGPVSFDVITTNPPYMIGQHGIANSSDTKAIARHEVLCTLDDILRESAKLLKQRGISNGEFIDDLKTQIRIKKLVSSISNIKILFDIVPATVKGSSIFVFIFILLQ